MYKLMETSFSPPVLIHEIKKFEAYDMSSLYNKVKFPIYS